MGTGGVTFGKELRISHHIRGMAQRSKQDDVVGIREGMD